MNFNSYKVAVSIFFGLLGFAINFYPIDFVFYGAYRMSFLLGLVFPMLITLAWGWRYGLLSALAGGCQTMWILWLPGSGFGPLVTVPPFTLWIVWHGSKLSKKYNIYSSELLFRIFNTVILYAFLMWAFSLNSPPANTYLPIEVVHSIVFKEAVNGLLIIFIAQGLLYSAPVRKFFKLPKSTADPRFYYTYMSAVILGCILFFSFVGETHIWGFWGTEFQYAARILGSIMLLMLGIFCTYRIANVFAKKKTEELIHIEEVLRESEMELSRLLQQANTDIIERKKVEERLNITMEELKRSNTDLEQFAYVASHDLHEPLRMINGYMRIIDNRYGDKIRNDEDNLIGSVLDGTKRMQLLIDDLLKYSHVGNRDNPMVSTDCEVVLEQVLSNLKTSIDDSGVVITHDPLPTVMADGSQLVHVFQNLICNSIKFKDGRPPRIHISAEKREKMWEFSVKDNGIGIKSEFFDKIFVIFHRLHSAEKYSGTGMGLSICKKVVEMHGGRMWVESKFGEGATFYFTV